MSVTVEGNTVVDVLQKLGAGPRDSTGLHIVPIYEEGYYLDPNRQSQFKVMPTVRFRVRYSSPVRSFNEIVDSIQELNKLIAPILRDHQVAHRELVKQREAARRKLDRERQKKLQDAVAKAKKDLKNFNTGR